MNEVIDRELEWNDTIEKDSDFVLLPEGDYSFTIESFERGRHNGSDKLPPCNKAVLMIKITAPEGETVIRHNLFLHTKTEGMLSAFFSSIGQKKKGEKLTMNWNTVTGATGRCKVGTHEFIGDDGNMKKYNQINRFYPKEDAKSFTPGVF